MTDFSEKTIITTIGIKVVAVLVFMRSLENSQTEASQPIRHYRGIIEGGTQHLERTALQITLISHLKYARTDSQTVRILKRCIRKLWNFVRIFVKNTD